MIGIKQTLVCPTCSFENDFEEYNKNEELYFYCVNCEYLIRANIPFLLLMKEFFLFLINSIFFFSIPIISLLLYENNDIWDKYLPFIFLFSSSIISIACHEFFHAITAFVLGDSSIFGRRYLRFDIKKYFNGFASFFFPTIIFFLCGIFLPGAAVYTDESKLNNRFKIGLVYIAGVVANLLILLFINNFLNNYGEVLTEQTKILLHTLAFIQIIIIVFNLLPIPPLDGWGVVSQVLNKTLVKLIEKFSLVIFIGIFYLAVSYDLFEYLVPIYDYLLKFFNVSSTLVSKGWSYLILYDPKEMKEILGVLLSKFNLNYF